MENQPRHIIYCSYTDEACLAQAIEVIKIWSEAHQGHRHYGWIKTAPNRVILFFRANSPISDLELANLFVKLSQLPGLGFANQEFS